MYDQITTKQMADFLDINIARLREWISGGHVSVKNPANGKGSLSRFSQDDVLKILVFKKIMDFGFSRPEADKKIKEMNFNMRSHQILLNLNFDQYRREIKKHFD